MVNNVSFGSVSVLVGGIGKKDEKIAFQLLQTRLLKNDYMIQKGEKTRFNGQYFPQLIYQKKEKMQLIYKLLRCLK